MQINFDKARKLINELEAKLNDTTAHTATARKVLDEWIQSGEGGLRKKGASALKEVRKRADSFNKSLARLELNIATSLDKVSDSLKKASKKGSKKASKVASKKTSKKASKKASGKAPSKKAVSVVKKAVKKTAAKPASVAPKKAVSPSPASKKAAPAKKSS